MSSDESDGFVDRLAKTLFASPNSPLTAFADNQRVERLNNCRGLERILKECHAANDEQEAITDAGTYLTDATELPASRSSARISRFFKWDGAEGQSAEQNGGGSVLDEAVSSFTEKDTDVATTQKARKMNRFSPSCAREAHELWACRALALGCGGYLAELRDCWSDANEMTYHKGSEQSCRKIQIDMSKCVNKNAAELAERVQKSKQQ